MEDFGSVWFYQESIDELRQKLQYTSFELEALKTKTNDQTRKHKEEIRSLLNLLKIAYKERDETKDQFRKLLKNLTQKHSDPNPILIPPKANSSITESNSFSLSHGSSPVDSFFDSVSSPELISNINMSDSSYQTGFGNQQRLVQNCSIQTAKIDPTDAVIDGLVEGKALPQKGKLLQTVMESGPLLQTLLVAGPLPRWRNPPPLQPFKAPPVLINGCDSMPKPAISRGCSDSQLCSSVSTMNFASCGVPGINAQVPVAKRQRFHLGLSTVKM